MDLIPILAVLVSEPIWHFLVSLVVIFLSQIFRWSDRGRASSWTSCWTSLSKSEVQFLRKTISLLGLYWVIICKKNNKKYGSIWRFLKIAKISADLAAFFNFLKLDIFFFNFNQISNPVGINDLSLAHTNTYTLTCTYAPTKSVYIFCGIATSYLDASSWISSASSKVSNRICFFGKWK